MDYLLDEDMYDNEVEYFFSLHGPRFEYMNKMMAISLGKKFGREFRAVRILNAWPGKQYDIPNYIVLNKKAYALAEELKKPVVYLPDYEDVNVEFSRSEFIAGIANELLKKQKTVYVYPFTTSFLRLPKAVFTILGPDSELASVFDNKVNQHKLFNELGLPCNYAKIYDDEQSLIEHESEIVPCYLSAAYTSGGNESGLIYDKQMLHEFLAKIRPMNKKNHFVVADIFEDLLFAPNVNALICNNGEVYILVLSDQILHGNRYLGNIFPSDVNQGQKDQIYAITKKLGVHLSGKGYRGLFGCDFLINKKGDLVVVDLNPRHQGGYACNALTLETVGISLTEIELSALFDKEVQLSQQDLNNSMHYSWGHSKMVPSEKGQVIQNEYHQGSMADTFINLGNSFVTEFYKEGSVFIDGYIGYQVHTAESRIELEENMREVRKVFDSRVLGL